MRKSDYEIWFNKYLPETDENVSHKIYETYGEDLEKIKSTPLEYVWTMIDVDGKMYISPGISVINRLHYIICDIPWGDEKRIYKY
jgi:hypothetical protein